jgi:SAM-dependent methyltransferase
VFRIHRHGFRVAEAPIHFAHRLAGESKIPRFEIVNGIAKLGYLFASRLVNPRPRERGNPLVDSACYACGSLARVERFPRRHVFESRRSSSAGALRASAPRIVQCLACGLLAAGEGAPRGVASEASRGAEDLERSFRSSYAQVAAWLPPPGRLLQAGPGSEAFEREARRHGWTAEEVAPDELAAELPEAGSFDVVALWEVLDRLEDPVGVLERVAEQLAPGGRLLLAVRDIEASVPRALGGVWPLVDIGRRYYLSAAVLGDWLARAGFEVAGVQPRRRYLSARHAAARLAAALPVWLAAPFRIAAALLPRRPSASVAFAHDKLVVARRVDESG